MWAGQSQTPERGGVRAQLIGDQQFGREALLLEQLAHQPQRRPTVAPTLNQHVEDLAFMVDGSPQKHPLAGDPHHHLIEVPAIARPRAAPAQPSRDHRSKFQNPTPDGFVRDVEPPLGQEFLDVPIAQREAQVDPDRMLDDRWRKAVAAVGDFSHRASLPSAPLPSYRVTLTTPLAHLLRDAQYAIDAGDTGFAPGFYKLLQRAVPLVAAVPISRTPPWSSTVPTSTAGLTGCLPSAPPPRPANSSPAVSASAAVISLSSSPAVMCPPLTTNASVPCGPA